MNTPFRNQPLPHTAWAASSRGRPDSGEARAAGCTLNAVALVEAAIKSAGHALAAIDEYRNDSAAMQIRGLRADLVDALRLLAACQGGQA